MIQIVLFIASCLLWQSIKNAIRGPRKITVVMEKTQRAGCGCEVLNNKIVKSCAAHHLLMETLKNV